MKIKGTFIYFDKENDNGRIYKKEMAQGILDHFNEKIEKGLNLGTFGYPDVENFNKIYLDKVSHIVEEVHYNPEKNTLDGTIRFLDTSVAKSIIESIRFSSDNDLPCSFSVRPRGIGNINPSTKEIENFEIISFDIIPAETDAFKQFKQNEKDEEKYFNC